MSKSEGKRVVIAGSREITDANLVTSVVENSKFDIGEVVCGTADGVDTLGAEWAYENNIPVSDFPITEYADPTDPRPNPLIRNEAMAKYADAAILIWNGESGGTDHMRRMAEKHDVEYILHRTDNTSFSDFC